MEAIETEVGKSTTAYSSKAVSERRRRSAADSEKLRKDVLAARAKGTSAAKLAQKYGVSTAYIYMIKA